MLTLNNINFSYGMVQVLTDVNMTFEPGTVTAIMGRNGVGKTTLIRNIIGLLRHSSGRIALDGQELSKLPANKRARAGIGLVPQGRQIFPKLSVEENLRIGLEASNGRAKSINNEIFEMFPVLNQMRNRNGGDLSGGQQQQLAIGRALASGPKVLLLDEPTEGIQPNIITQIGHVLRKLAQERNMAIVLVEQYLDFVREFASKFYVMNRGRVVAAGATNELSDEVIRHHLSV